MVTKPNKPLRRKPSSSILGMDWEDLIRERIQNSKVANRLIAFVNGEISLEPSQVTAALGLLKKVLPDLSASENKTTVEHRYVARVPNKAGTTTEWLQTYAPKPDKTLQ